MWYILNYIPPRGKRRSMLQNRIDAFNSAGTEEPLELFAPTFTQLKTENGHVIRAEKPLLYHYIFVKGQEKDIKRLCQESEGFSFIIDHAQSQGRHLTVSDETVEQFKIIAGFYAGKLPCYPLDGINLEEGDKVQIVSGPFAGLKGTYISRKGGKSGNILVAIDKAMAAIVYDIKAEYVSVLEFSKDTKRIYDQLDAFAGKLPKIKPLDPDLKLLAAANVFSQRLGVLKDPNPKTSARLKILLYAAYRILSDNEKAAEALSQFRDLEMNITNQKTKEFCENILRFY